MIFAVTEKGESKAMTEYIAREQTISAIMSDCPELVYYNKKEAISCIESIPAADVVPVVHGKWIRQDESFTRFKCSNPECGIGNCSGFENFCPNCGAKMDEN